MSHFVTWVTGNNYDTQLMSYVEGGELSFTLEPLEELGAKHGIGTDEEVKKFIGQSMVQRDPILIVSEAMAFDEDGQLGYQIIDLVRYGVKSVLVSDFEGNFVAIKKVIHHGKWDWYEVGGRWAGMLRLGGEVIPLDSISAGTETVGIKIRHDPNAPEEIKKLFKEYGNSEATYPPDRFDRLPKRYIDFPTMEQEFLESDAGSRMLKRREILRGEYYPKWHEFWQDNHEGSGIPSSKEFEEIRQKYHEHPMIKQLKEADLGFNGMEDDTFYDVEDEEVFLSIVKGFAWRPYAFLHEGTWYQRGEMLLFGLSDDELTLEEWDAECRRIVAELDGDTPITVVDCHC